MTEPLLKVRGLSAAYGPIRALNGIDLDVPGDGVVALLGPNGAGKTTLVKALTGLLKATAGTATLAGTPLVGRTPEKLAGLGIAVVPEGRRVFPGMSVADNLLSGAFRHRHDSAGVASAAERTYEMFPRLKERADQLAGSLSGGEQQMLAVGRALMTRPRLLILDEPSLGLAPRIVEGLYDALGEIHTSGTAMLLIEQNVEMAARLCRYGYVVVHGRVVARATSEQLREVAAESYLAAG